LLTKCETRRLPQPKRFLPDSVSLLGESFNQQTAGWTGLQMRSTLSTEAGPLCRNEGRKEGRMISVIL